ncbi:unnamed protein product, partial [Ectocarpus sp. 8 AP-2014]
MHTSPLEYPANVHSSPITLTLQDARPLQDHNATATPVLEYVGCLGRGTLEKLCTALPYGCDDERDALD